MMQVLKKAIMDSISEVLETMFFMVIEFDESDAMDTFTVDRKGRIIGCFLQFRGPFSGHFILLVKEGLLTEMAIDFMGEEPENLTDRHVNGTITEALNMIAGNAFGNYDDSIEFTIGIPNLMTDDEISSCFQDASGQDIWFKIQTPACDMAVKVVVTE